MPEVAIVAAWIRADTGVGPAIASGSHTKSGICADLPIAPTNSRATMAVAVTGARVEAPWMMPEYCKVPSDWKTRNIANMKPQWPMRLVTKAFLPAEALATLVNQNEMRR